MFIYDIIKEIILTIGGIMMSKAKLYKVFLLVHIVLAILTIGVLYITWDESINYGLWIVLLGNIIYGIYNFYKYKQLK